MKTRNVLFFCIITILAANSVFAQIKVANSGWVSIGSVANPYEKLHVAGNALFSPCLTQCTNSSAYIRGVNGYSTPLNPDYTWWYNDQTGIYHPSMNHIGFSSDGRMKMMISPNGVEFFPSLMVYGGVWTGTDERSLKGTKPIESALDKVLNLKGQVFEYKNELIKSQNLGFSVQELKAVLPEVVTQDSSGRYLINYNQIMPVIIEAIKEQQNQINDLKTLLLNCNNHNTATFNRIDETNFNDGLVLNQNEPNPFNGTTIIKCNIPQNVSDAKLYFYNIQGVIIKQITIYARGSVSEIIQGNGLSTGIYTYILVCDGQASEVRQMILTK